MSDVRPAAPATDREDPTDAAESSSGLTQTRSWRRHSPLAWVLLAVLRLYRATRAVRGPRCRFHPTCSQYATEAVRRHGGLRGGAYAVRRLARCHPWNPGGVDPVPTRR